jgi:hypothetical protein
MKRFVAMVAVAAMAVGAGAAEAAIKKGKFVGQTAKGDPMGLKVNKNNEVFAYFYDGVHLKCTDGDELDTPSGADRIQTPNDVPFTISSSRKWSIRARDNDNGVGWDVAARFNKAGTKTKGTLSVFALFNEQSEQDPNGNIRCEVKNLKFTLKRK